MAVRPLGRILAVAISLVLTTACAGPGSTPGPAPSSAGPVATPGHTLGPATPPPTAFSSSALPYTIVLPAGWVTLSTAADEDLYESADLAWTLNVGTGNPEPGQTVEDRVRINRASEFAGCDMDPATDRVIMLGGERGILWAFTCGPLTGLAANTIHDGVGYRLTLRVLDDAAAAQIEPVMAGIVAGFAFTE